MEYYSTNNKSIRAGFREATIQGQAADRGLYFPSELPMLSPGFLKSINQLSKEEIAFEVIKPFIGNTIPASQLQDIVTATVDFDFPLVPVTGQVSSLELFHGPTLAFKDVGARFMSRCLDYFARDDKKKFTVLVATSGDTGGAVAHAFYGLPGVSVIILYPSGKVSPIQELQLTSLGKNVKALELDGNFDDCQLLVKKAFNDPSLREKLSLTSANSINIARWLPQQFYYFFAWQQWKDKQNPPVVSVPSGNFGNICAGLLAFKSGLPARHFIAACNQNDTVPEFMHTGNYLPKPAKPTISNAMDVGDPSNFIRILELFGDKTGDLQKILTACSISDERTKDTIRKVYQDRQYLLDPHGAVGYTALEDYLSGHPGEQGYFLETAHPVKFQEVVEPVTGEKMAVPASLQSIAEGKKQSTRLPVSYDALREILLNGAA